jgi:COP9 signalosome complex subunit 3
LPSTSSLGIDGHYPCSKHKNSSGYITVKSGLTNEVSVAAVQQYYVCGAMIYIGLRMWEEALVFLELVLVTPNQSVSNGFMLEAYKKWILVGCMLNGRVSHIVFAVPVQRLTYGKPSDISKSANANAIRTLKAAAKPYEALGEIFATGDRARLVAEIDAGSSLWTEVIIV